MALKIQGKKTNEQTPTGPHAEEAKALAATTSEYTAMATTPSGDVVNLEADSIPGLAATLPHDEIEVGMSYKFPLQQYHMLEVSVRQRKTYPAGDDEAAAAAYAEAKAFVDEKVNEIISENAPEE